MLGSVHRNIPGATPSGNNADAGPLNPPARSADPTVVDYQDGLRRLVSAWPGKPAGTGPVSSELRNSGNLDALVRKNEGRQRAPNQLQRSAAKVLGAMRGAGSLTAARTVLYRQVRVGEPVLPPGATAEQSEQARVRDRQFKRDLTDTGHKPGKNGEDGRNLDWRKSPSEMHTLMLAHLMADSKAMYDKNVDMIDGDVPPEVLIHALGSVVQGAHHAQDPQAQFDRAWTRAQGIQNTDIQLRAEAAIMMAQPLEVLAHRLDAGATFGQKTGQEKLAIIQHIAEHDPHPPSGWLSALQKLPPGDPMGTLAPFLQSLAQVKGEGRVAAFDALRAHDLFGQLPVDEPVEVMQTFCAGFHELPASAQHRALESLRAAYDALPRHTDDRSRVLPALLDMLKWRRDVPPGGNARPAGPGGPGSPGPEVELDELEELEGEALPGQPSTDPPVAQAKGDVPIDGLQLVPRPRDACHPVERDLQAPMVKMCSSMVFARTAYPITSPARVLTQHLLALLETLPALHADQQATAFTELIAPLSRDNLGAFERRAFLTGCANTLFDLDKTAQKTAWEALGEKLAAFPEEDRTLVYAMVRPRSHELALKQDDAPSLKSRAPIDIPEKAESVRQVSPKQPVLLEKLEPPDQQSAQPKQPARQQPSRGGKFSQFMARFFGRGKR